MPAPVAVRITSQASALTSAASTGSTRAGSTPVAAHGRFGTEMTSPGRAGY